MKVSDYVVDFLAEKGIDTIFGYQGSSVAHTINSISSNGKVKYVQLYHEQAAGFAANAYACVRQDSFGVAIACSGPGSTNLITSIANAFYDSIPCLYITGQVSTNGIRKDKSIRQLGFQETDIVEIVKPITKYAVRIDEASKIGYYLDKAYYLMINGRQGPVLIDIPHNIQASHVDLEKIEHFNPTVGKQRQEEIPWTQIMNLLKKSKRPLVLIGGGIHGNKCKEKLYDVIHKYDLPVVSSYRGKDKFDNFDIHYIGTIGAYGNRYANLAVRYCDLLLVIGSRIDGRQTGDDMDGFAPSANIIYVDIDQNEIATKPSRYIKVNCDAEKFLIELCEQITIRADKKWMDIIQKWKIKMPNRTEYRIEEYVNPQAMLEDLSLLIKNDQYFTTSDVGQNQIWVNSSAIIGKKGLLLQSCGLGAMGYSLPAAIGAYFARKVMAISINGDGGIQMNMQELQTIARERLPIKIFVFNNKSLGLIRIYQKKALGGNYVGSVEGYSSPDYEKIAGAYGLEYCLINNNNYMDSIRNILNKKIAILVEVIISSDSTSYPEPAYKRAVYDQEPMLTKNEWKDLEGQVYGM